MTVKLLLDTDIGSDIDDAVCLAYLLAQPQCELLGITTVSGEAQQRAMLASALCHAANQTVPILPGTEAPLRGTQHQPRAPQAAMLPQWRHDTDFPHDQAITFLSQTIRDNPGEITLLAIGPMTNVARLFIEHPETCTLLKSLVLMCGHFTHRSSDTEPLEWNALCDPEAADVVYRTPVAIHRSVGLDVTRQVTMPSDEVHTRFQAPLLLPVRDFAEVWFMKRDLITFHDPLAAATLFDDQICGFEHGIVEVELDDRETRGKTHWHPVTSGATHEVATSVDREQFFEHYFSVFQ